MNSKVLLLILLIIGSAAMYFLLYIRAERYQFQKNKIFTLLIPLFLAGYFGTKLLFLIENGYYDGQSYYGAIFFVPIVFLFISAYYKIGYGKLLSYCAPCGCIIHIVMKIGCLLSGCCGGNDLYEMYCILPLQAVEGIVSLIILFVLVIFENSGNTKYFSYGLYMIIQGISRFVLNSFRKNLTVFFILPAGHVWSIVSVLLGYVYLRYYVQINTGADTFGYGVLRTFRGRLEKR